MSLPTPYYQDSAVTIYNGKPGPKKGYKQTPEHIAKRKRFGEEHHNWKGNGIKVRSGRTRAERAFHAPNKCEECGREKCRIDRHHKDGNTANNLRVNIAFLCRRCHMKADGRLAKFKELARKNQPYAVASRWS